MDTSLLHDAGLLEGVLKQPRLKGSVVFWLLPGTMRRALFLWFAAALLARETRGGGPFQQLLDAGHHVSRVGV